MQNPTIPTETEEQQTLIAWADLQPFGAGHVGDFLAAIPNGAATASRYRNGKRFSTAAQKLKREGLRPGFPDLFLALPAGQFHGLFIEMKRAKKSLSKVSPEQLVWQGRLAAQGYKSVVCYGFDAAKQEILSYLGQRKT